jgi:FkbM family methyltransferase
MVEFDYTFGEETYTFECSPNWASKWMADLVLAGVTYPHFAFVDDVRVVLDAGANVGAAATYFARCYPDAEIYAFEPASAAFDVLARNAARLSNVRPVNIGLEAEDGRAELYLGDIDSVLASIHPSADLTQTSESIELRSARGWADEHGLDRIDVLKVDTEGCEVPILRSLVDRLDQVKIIYVEYHSEADRREIDALLGPTHALFFGRVVGSTGELAYVAHDLVPSSGAFDVAPLFKNLVPG